MWRKTDIAAGHGAAAGGWAAARGTAWSRGAGLLLLCAMSLVCTAEAQGPVRRDLLSVATSPGVVNFLLRPSGIAPGSSAINITTAWEIQRGGTQVIVYAYFANPGAALSGGTSGTIPTSRVFGKVGAQPYVPFTGAGPFSGGSLLVFTQQVRNNKRATRTDSLHLQIDTTGLGLTPGVFSGVLRIQAQAF